MTSVDAHGSDIQFSTREVPWMKLGQLEDNPLTAKEAAKAGGIDFTVSAKQLAFAQYPDNEDGDGIHWAGINDRVAIVRDDTHQPLSIVSKGYPILQYGEAFDFMDEAVNGSDTRYVAAGALRGGRQGFMVVRAPQEAQRDILNGDDRHEFFFVLRTSHDRTRGCEVMVMPLRGRCMNQLTLSSFSKNVQQRWSVRHTSTMTEKLAEVKSALAKVGEYTERYAEVVEKLVTVKLTENQARQILEKVETQRAKTDEKIDSILHLWNEGETVGYDGTGWGLVNAVSDYYDWGRTGGSPESRFLAALEGQTFKAVNRTAGLILSRS
jgi:phage/plasmid-like protein (TIGR03299 family)